MKRLIVLLFAGIGISCSAPSIPENCEIRVDGVCFMETAPACKAANCPMDRCMVLESYPGQIQCMELCDVRYEGVCYPDSTSACEAAQCPPERCTILRSEPGQVQCQPAQETEEPAE